jgi:hypothetical protein
MESVLKQNSSVVFQHAVTRHVSSSMEIDRLSCGLYYKKFTRECYHYMFWLNWPSSGACVSEPDKHTVEHKKLHQQVHMKTTRNNFKDCDHHNQRTAIFLTFRALDDGQLS